MRLKWVIVNTWIPFFVERAVFGFHVKNGTDARMSAIRQFVMGQTMKFLPGL